MSYKIIEKQEGDLKGLVIEVKNGVFIIISEDEYKFGTTAVALPIKSDEGTDISSIIPTYGSRNEVLARSIAEKVAHKLSKTVISTVLIKIENQKNVENAL
ncbi:MAG: hypothetical protein ACTSQY_01610, partial [Candidatus Odinarchaeia archaeon]